MHPKPYIIPKKSSSRTTNSTQSGSQAHRGAQYTMRICQEKNLTEGHKNPHILELSVTDNKTIILTMFKEIKDKFDIIQREE